MSEVISPENLQWRKSSFSGSNGCVELAAVDGGLIALRDSKNPQKGFFVYNSHEIRCFALALRHGEFDDLMDG